MRRNQTALAYAGIVFVNIVWGLSFIASKYALQAGFAPFTLALVRFVMSTALLLPLTLARHGLPRYGKREWLCCCFRVSRASPYTSYLNTWA